MARGLLDCRVNLPLLNFQNHNKGNDIRAGSAKNRKDSTRGALSNEALAAIGACVVLVVLVALTMRDKKPRFRFDSTPAPSATATPLAPEPSGSATPVPASDLQALFVQGRAESPLIAPVEDVVAPPFVPNTDYASQPVYREIRETDLGRMYAAAPKNDKRALDKVAKLGGFGSPEAMARAFGYPSVDQMLWNWDRTITATPRFQADNFGTNASPPLPWQD